METHGDPQILNSLLQSILNTAHKALSVDQMQLLAQEIQQTAGSAPGDLSPRLVYRSLVKGCLDTTSTDQRKTTGCDGTDCPGPSSRRRGMQAPNTDLSLEFQTGRFRCACSEWVSLKDETGFTLAPWVAHLVCKHSSTATAPYRASALGNEGSTLKSNYKGPSLALCNAQSVPGEDHDKSSSISATAQINTSHSLGTTQFTLSQVVAVTYPNNILAPSIERADEPDKPTPNRGLSLPTADSGLGISRLPTDTHAKQRPSQALRWNAPSGRRRPNRTEAERIHEFHSDPHVAEVEPYRVRCALCNRWIKLRNNSRYCSIPWRCHRDGCTRMHRKLSSSIGQSSTSHQLPKLDPSTPQSSVTNNALPNLDHSVPPPSVHPSLQTAQLISSSQMNSIVVTSGLNPSNTSSKTLRRVRLWDEEQRRATLLADPHTDVVESNRVLCSVCKKWVKLRSNATYCWAPWHSHIERCITRNKKLEVVKGLEEQSSNADDGKSPITYRPGGRDYRETCDPQNTEIHHSAEELVRAPFHKQDSSKQGSSKGDAPKRRGRPPKNKTFETKMVRVEDEMDSVMSYESEEQ